MEALLFDLLRRLRPEDRRLVLTRRFSEAQRLALERWALAHKAVHDSSGQVPRRAQARVSAVVASADNPGRGCGARPGGVPRPSGKRRLAGAAVEGRRANGCDGALPGLSGGASGGEPPRSPPLAGAQRWPVPCSKIRGIRSHRSGAPAACRVRYYASVVAGPFRLETKHDHDLDTVVRFHSVLVAIRDRVRGGGACGRQGETRPNRGTTREAAEVFRQAVLSEPKARGLDASADMGLSFLAAVGAKHWVGRQLATPRFPVAELEEGLDAWRQLREARETAPADPRAAAGGPRQLAATWGRLRAAYVKVWTRGNAVGRGSGREEILAKLCALEAARAAAGPRRRLLGSGGGGGRGGAGRERQARGIEQRVGWLLRRWPSG